MMIFYELIIYFLLNHFSLLISIFICTFCSDIFIRTSLYSFQYCSILWFYFSFISLALTLQISNHLFYCDLSWLLLWVLKKIVIESLHFVFIHEIIFTHTFSSCLVKGNISKSILFFPMLLLLLLFHCSVLPLKIYLLCWPLLKSIHFGVR